MSRDPLIIALTGFVNEDVQRKTREAGFDNLIEAPLSPSKIKDIIDLYNIADEALIAAKEEEDNEALISSCYNQA